MDAEFWHIRWRENRIAFHQGDTNKLLMKHWPAICPDKNATVFVPLCGKSVDMIWLAERGHTVIGVELSDVAIDAFFAENGLTPTPTEQDGFIIKSSGSIALWCGDFFALEPRHVSAVSAVYDRASLIALPPELRQRYAVHMGRTLPKSAQTLLLTITYDQSEMDGPPFSVTTDEVQDIYGEWATVNHLETRDAFAGSQNLQERGVTAVTTSVYRISAQTHTPS
ncbi:MAG: thiopurine S-methyltransferase [Pseudomonadota bacterium]